MMVLPCFFSTHYLKLQSLQGDGYHFARSIMWSQGHLSFISLEKNDYLKDKIHPSFVKGRGAMKREYKEFKERISASVHLGSAGLLVPLVWMASLVCIIRQAGAMNALLNNACLAVLTNAPFMLNLDRDGYINNIKAIRKGMCFLMDPQCGKKLCRVQ
ncbi:hypothetical protein V6N11_077389 [Hibiscus sabdariffa]|uniref:Uncharacterized protein n=1 Tax=Hibiscus sabdariffa TaxID=183260 RepID=A0ABR2TDQ8_9ROSI